MILSNSEFFFIVILVHEHSNRNVICQLHEIRIRTAQWQEPCYILCDVQYFPRHSLPTWTSHFYDWII